MANRRLTLCFDFVLRTVVNNFLPMVRPSSLLRGMRIGILSFRSKDSEVAVEDLKLLQAAQDLGHEVLHLFAWDCRLDYEGGLRVMWKGKAFPQLDLLFPRARFVEEAPLQLQLLEALEQVVPTVNSTMAISTAKNKIKTLDVLTRKGILMPNSEVWDVSQPPEAAGQPFPLVLKPPYGTFGQDIFLVRSLSEMKDRFAYYFEHKITSHCLVQAFIEEAQGCDFRVFVSGGRVLASMKRCAQKGEFRANVELGAHVSKVETNAELETLAIAATEAMGLDYAGVDIIESKRGFLVLEVNANPGFKALEALHRMDIARAIIQDAERRFR